MGSCRSFSFVVLLAGSLLGLAGAGCSPPGPPRGKVQGRVTLGGKPVTGATVFFENAQEGVALNAPLDEDGAYEAKTYKGVGLPAGSYQVAVVPGGVLKPGEEVPLAGKEPAGGSRPPRTPVPARYHQTATSKLTIEVKAGDNPPFDFALTD